MFIEEGEKEEGKEDKTAGKEEEGEHTKTGDEEGEKHEKSGEKLDKIGKHDGMTIFILINFNNLHAFVRDSAVLH